MWLLVIVKSGTGVMVSESVALLLVVFGSVVVVPAGKAMDAVLLKVPEALGERVPVTV